MVSYLAIALIVLAAAVVLILQNGGIYFNGAFVIDPFSRLIKLLVLIGSGVAIVMSINFMQRRSSIASSTRC